MKKIFNCLLLLLLFLSLTAFTAVGKKITNEKIIFIDPGHGGMDGGTSYEGIVEKKVNLSFSFVLKEVLENNGFKVYMTRTDDTDLANPTSKNRKRDDIYKRVDLINSSNCMLYLSIHSNSFSDRRVKGAQVFYNGNNLDSCNLAKSIQKSINECTNNEKNALKISDKYLIDNVYKVGCLVEIGFISNYDEGRLLLDNGYQLALSYAILVGINQYEEIYS